MKTAFVFPGQGSQAVGMGKELAEEYLKRASFILGFDLMRIVLEGPEEELRKTENQQPAIFAVSVAAFEYLKEKGFPCQAMAGHSLGEYSALYAAGSLSFEEGIKITHLRGKFMQEAVPEGEGAMAAVLGGEKKVIEEICQKIGNVWPANYNSPEQIVISGKKDSVELARAKLKEAGVKRIVPLSVSAPFHCPLMQPAAEKLARELKRIEFKEATIPVYANVTGKPVTSPAEIKSLLIRQVTGSVLWEDTIKNMIADGISHFVEVGPGKVLSGLISKIDSKVEVTNYVEANR